MKLQLQKVGDQLACLLPDEVAARLRWEAGDVVELSVGENNLQVVRTQTAFDRAMEIARSGMDEYRETLATLAKS